LLTMSNFVGQQGKNGCHMHCPLKSCWKPGPSQYYPVLLKPNNYNITGCNHGDVNIYDVSPSTSMHYVTGIVGPSIPLGLQPYLVLGIPKCFPSEMMHLSGANMAALSEIHIP
ncbi:hypothetical protein BKA82DRAFT_158079, partial [Pisolithus tinctorius]